MGQTLDQVVAELAPDRRDRVETRYRGLRREVEGLRELRQSPRAAVGGSVQRSDTETANPLPVRVA